jgi:hypothetical protein
LGDGNVMINISKWLRHRWYAIEDLIDDLLPRPSATPPMKPPPPRPKPAPPVIFAVCGATFNRASPEQVDALWTQQIFRQMAANKYFELDYR